MGPSGPARDNSRYTIRPTTTGGSPMRAFNATINVCRPGKRVIAISAPSGRPITAAARTAVRLTLRLSATIA